jgi:DHA3 family tetracycline resistance protein-like MFS transporter
MKLSRDAYKIFLGITWVEWLLDSLFTTVVFIYRATKITDDPFQLTLIEVVFTITLILTEIPTGVIADVLSRRLSVILGFIVTGVAALIQGGFPTLGMILLSQALWAVGFTFISGALDAWIADEIGEERVGKAYVRSSQISQIAIFMGIPIAAGLGSIAINLPILLAGVGHLLLAAVLIVIMPEEGFKPQAEANRISWNAMFSTFKDGLALVRGRTVLIAILTMSAIFGMSSMGFDNLWTVHMLENHAFPDIGSLQPVVWFGAFNVIVSLLGLAGTEYVRRKLDLNAQRTIVRALTYLTTAAAFSMVAFGLSRNFWLAAAAYCLSLTLRTVSMPLIKTWTNLNVDSSVRATVLSMDEQFFSLGETFGGPAIGAVGSLLSLRVALVTTGLIRLPVTAIFLRYLNQRKPDQTADTI